MSDTIEGLNAALSGRFRVEAELGRGGMGTVFRAEDLRHGREVALKVVDPALAHAVGSERFLEEIRIAATLQHPHILPLFDSGEAGGHLFYAMPFVEGRSLRELLEEETQLPIDRAVDIAREVSAGLAHAHAKGVVHRDIKPENILIYGGYAVLADFGVASALSRAGGDKLTPTGLAVGSPSYMAPEQMRDEGTADGRADLYALGCVLYEMLVGAPPFTGPTARVIMARHASDPVPPIRTVRSTVPAELEAVVTRCLAKVPADRFQSADELARALEAAGIRGPAPPLAASPDRPAAGTAAGPPASPPRAGAPAASPPPVGPAAPDDRTPQGELADGSTFFQELKRRNVYKAAAVYGVVALSLVQAAQLAFPTFGIEWAFDFVVMAAVLGFPLVLVLAWVYDLTREGIRRATPWGTPLPEPLAAGAARRMGVSLAVMGAGGFVAFAVLYPFGYGEATVLLEPNQADARGSAERFLATHGAGAPGRFREARRLERSGRVMEYLQRAVGFQEARQLAGEEIPVWRWRFRWFRPGEEEEWEVAVGSGARILGFEHRIPDTVPGPLLGETEAEGVALSFLEERGWDRGALERVGMSTRSLPERTDHSFTWRAPGTAIAWVAADGGRHEGNVELEVEVQGDRVGNYRAGFEVPQTFQREVERRSVMGDGFLWLAVVAIWLLTTISLVVLGRKGVVTLRWRGPLAAAATGAVLLAVWEGLGFPAEQFEYATETPWAAFGGGRLLAGMLVAVFFGVVALPLAAGTDAFGRLLWPGRMAGWTDFFRGRLRNEWVARDLRWGVGLAGVMLGWRALGRAVEVRIPDAWGLAGWSHFSHAADLWPALSIVTSNAGMTIFFVLFLAAAVAMLSRYLRSTAAAVMIVALVPALLVAQDTHPVYASATLATVASLVAAVALVALGPLVVLSGLYVTMIVPEALPFLFLGDAGSLVTGGAALCCALLPLVPTFLARRADEEPGADR